MHEAKQRVKEKLQAGTADVGSDAAAAATDTLADTGLSGLEDEAAPATGRSMATPTGEVMMFPTLYFLTII